MTKHRIGDKDLILEEKSCISETLGADANRVYVSVWLKGCKDKIQITIHAEDEEINKDPSGGMNLSFMKRAYNEFDFFQGIMESYINKNKL